MENDVLKDLFLPERRSDIKAVAAINKLIWCAVVILIIVAAI